MKTVTLSVASREDVTRRARAAFKGKMQGAHISFASVKLLWQTLKKTVGAAESDDRARCHDDSRDSSARRSRRNGVHGDVHALL
jgi:hypothetical protein